MLKQPTKVFMVLFALAIAGVPVDAFAQQQQQPATETIHGTIVSFDAGNLQLHDDRGYIDKVLVDGDTVVQPSGEHLQAGMRVAIVGFNAGPFFAAREVDAQPSYSIAEPPYSTAEPYPYAAYPYPAYPYPVYAYPYPVYAYPWPAVSIGIGFGWGFHGRWR